jgi:hypothetical protein
LPESLRLILYWKRLAIVENWKQEYNNYRPHSSLGYLTPSEFARRYYKKKQVTEVKQPVEKAGSLSL